MSENLKYLKADTILPEGQEYVCLSFLRSKEDEKVTLTGIKVRGVFSNYDEACSHAKALQSIDEYHHVFVGKMGEWLPYDPDPDSKFVKNSEYANVQLNEMMKKYQENQEKAKLFHEHQKNEQMKKNLTENINNVNKNKKELMDELNENKDESRKEFLLKNIEKIEENIKKMEKKQEDLETLNKGITAKLNIGKKQVTQNV